MPTNELDEGAIANITAGNAHTNGATGRWAMPDTIAYVGPCAAEGSLFESALRGRVEFRLTQAFERR